ncbi:hypothetical protein BP5796_03078 [Coleophoma crateriformis]|uniref:Azaphilone pigments biosynthesis cluster protein L N-terminal domain-containing protein n=1 Tax=Coleophoma crateriformis TaxID=565419 RepID=A0A3D8SMH3_9HELO|nr:hypothetical protein BP5796_03078 [Coleophoma crateriformis]
MADPPSVTASTIAVAGLAYASSRVLYEFISTIRDTPHVFQELNQYVAALNLDGRGGRLSESQVACLQEVKPTLEGCDAACKDFKTQMEELTAHSQGGRRSFKDSIKLNFQNKNIADFRMRVVAWKESLALALDVVLLTSMSANTDAFKALEVKIANAEVQITTDLKIVNTRLERLLALELESDEDLKIMTRKNEVEEQQKTTLIQCLSLCQAAADGITKTTGHSFKNNKVFGEARATYGDVGHVPAGSTIHSYNSNIASDKARVVMGNMDVASFLEFMR